MEQEEEEDARAGAKREEEDVLVLPHNVDCTEVSAALGLACAATYEYDAARDVRRGGIHLFPIRAGRHALGKETRFVDCGGVFDVRFNGHLLGVACANGSVGVIDARNETAATLRWIPHEEARDGNGEGAKTTQSHCLCLDWDRRPDMGYGILLSDCAVSGYSDGRLEFATLEGRAPRRVIRGAHAFSSKRHGNEGPAEIWSVASSSSVGLAASGGDDGVIALWDERAASPSAGRIAGAHQDAGVCCVIFDSGTTSGEMSGNVLLSGGYDQTLKSWDLRYFSRAVSTTPPLGGGVWRIRRRDKRLALACMRGGFTIAPREEALWSQTSSFLLHSETGDRAVPWEALAYGVDWLDDETVLGGTFYDKSVRLVRV